MIKVYALSTCPWCKKLKQFLDLKNIPYECVDVDTAEAGLQQAALKEVDRLAGERVFPITVVGGRVFKGYQPERIVEALKDEV